MSHFDHHLASIVVASLFTLAPPVIQAQSLDSISANTRVRIDFPAGERSRFRRERAQSVVELDSVARRASSTRVK
jgi:hypothetical protein